MEPPIFVTFIDEDRVPHMINAAYCHLMWVGGKHLVQVSNENRSYAFVGELKFDLLPVSLGTFNGMINALRAQPPS